MLSVFVNAWKIKEMRIKLLYVLLMLAVYRIGCHIGAPGLNLVSLQNQGTESLFQLISGGSQGSIFAMGIGPYITSSIIMQLLTVAIPKLEQIQKEGEEGRKKIDKYTRYLALGLAILQASGTIYSYRTAFMNPNMFSYITAVITLVTGSMFIVWLSDLLTESGVGNGSSFIIFANILANLPNAVNAFISMAMDNFPIGLLIVFILIVLFIGVIAFVVWIQDGERRIPVQYSKKMVGRQMYGGQSSFIPIKVNIAGVMSIIFAVSLLQFPAQVKQFFPNVGWLSTLSDYLAIHATTTHPGGAHPVGAILYVILIFCFTFFYTSFAINPTEMAENMRKNGGFIPGIRPGKPTSEYIVRTVDRLSWIGAIFYVIVAMVPVAAEWVLKSSIGFGGTTLLIVTGVALEFIKQLESQLLMRHHKGFLS